MKIQFLYIPIFVLLVLAGFFLQSCAPTGDDECEPAKTTTYPISDGVRARVPYSGYDTLTFIRSSTGDTHTFIGQGPKEGYDTMYITGMKDESCPFDKAVMGWLSYVYTSSTFNSSKIRLDVYYRSYGEQPYIDMSFNGEKYQISSASIRQPYDYDSLQIYEHVFYNIIKYSTSIDPGNNDFFVLYNTSSGILKFKFTNGDEWALLSKK